VCNNKGLRDCRELLVVCQQNVREYIFYDEAIKSKNRNLMGSETLYDSVREASATGIPLIEICNKLLFAIVSMTKSLSMTHSLVFPFFSFNCSESVIFIGYIILLQVAPKLSHFCKMTRRSVVGPH